MMRHRRGLAASPRVRYMLRWKGGTSLKWLSGPRHSCSSRRRRKINASEAMQPSRTTAGGCWQRSSRDGLARRVRRLLPCRRSTPRMRPAFTGGAGTSRQLAPPWRTWTDRWMPSATPAVAPSPCSPMRTLTSSCRPSRVRWSPTIDSAPMHSRCAGDLERALDALAGCETDNAAPRRLNEAGFGWRDLSATAWARFDVDTTLDLALLRLATRLSGMRMLDPSVRGFLEMARLPGGGALEVPQLETIGEVIRDRGGRAGGRRTHPGDDLEGARDRDGVPRQRLHRGARDAVGARHRLGPTITARRVHGSHVTARADRRAVAARAMRSSSIRGC